MNRKSAYALLLVAATLTGACQKPAAPAASPSPTAAAMTDEEKTIYALGAMIGQKFAGPMRLSEKELETLQRGIKATARGGQPEFPVAEYAAKFDALARSRAMAGAADNKAQASAFRDAAAAEAGAIKLDSGLVYKTIKPGSGTEPEGHRRGARALPRHASRREGVRQLRPARRARRVPAQPGDPVLDRGRAAHEAG